MSKLLVLKGLPASGKSTYAKELVNKGWKRVNKDDLRAMIDGGRWSRDNEKSIKEVEKSIVIDYLTNKYNVVIDDTNFAYEDYWKDVFDDVKFSSDEKEQNNFEFEVKFFDVPVLECVERDSKRGDKSVGAKVIFGMYDRYLKPKLVEHNRELSNCYIFDIDGTLAKICCPIHP